MAITHSQYLYTANRLKVEPATLQAICKVVSGGEGILPDGRPKILFEGHIFWNQLINEGINPEEYVEGNEDILYQYIDKTKYAGDSLEYERQEKASKINKNAALLSASYGSFQIMGFNYAFCGFTSIEAFVDSMKEESLQLLAFVHFIQKNGLLKDLQENNWDNFAYKYGGLAYKENNFAFKLKLQYDYFTSYEKKAAEKFLQG